MTVTLLIPVSERVLTAPEIGAMFRVDSKTASRWLKNGKLRGFKTPGGQWRAFEAEVLALLAREGG